MERNRAAVKIEEVEESKLIFSVFSSSVCISKTLVVEVCSVLS